MDDCLIKPINKKILHNTLKAFAHGKSHPTVSEKPSKYNILFLFIYWCTLAPVVLAPLRKIGLQFVSCISRYKKSPAHWRQWYNRKNYYTGFDEGRFPCHSSKTWARGICQIDLRVQELSYRIDGMFWSTPFRLRWANIFEKSGVLSRSCSAF